MSIVIAAGHTLDVERVPALRPDAPTIVFLHEGLGCRELWRDFPARVRQATGCGTVVFSRWGYGRSEERPGTWPACFMHDEALETLPDVLAHVEADRPVLYGHSDGGSIALIYAARHPNLVRGVISEAAHVFVEELTANSIAMARKRFTSGTLRAQLAKYHGANTDSLFHGWADVWLSPEFRAWDIRPLMPNVRCPLLVVQGRHDEYGTLAQVDAIAAGVAGPVDRLVIDDCGHAPHAERPLEVLRTLGAFIERLSE